jgi:hypothetical protein
MVKRREFRYNYELANYAVFGFEKKKEEPIIYKGLINERKIDQRNSENSVRKCEYLTFDHDFTVDEPLVAAEYNDMNKNHIGKQSQGIESIQISIHGTKFETSEIVQFNMGDEFNLVSTTQSIDEDPREGENFNNNIYLEEMVNQRNSRRVEQRCGSNAFNHDSIVDETTGGC